MALLTADDVLNKKFQATKFREGYDQDEVDDFLDEVVNTLRAVRSENEELQGKLAAAERRVAELTRAGAQASASAEESPADAPAPETSSTEAATTEAATPADAPAASSPEASSPEDAGRPSEPESATGMLLLAQKLHDDYVRNGQEEGDRILDEAKAESTRMVHEAEETSRRTLSQLEEERSLLERKIDELRVFERDYRTRLKGYLENLLGDLDSRGSALPAPRPEQTAGAAEGGL